MNYIIHYEIAALILTVVLLGIYFFRRSYKTRPNTLFFVLLVFAFLVGFFDVISAFTISNPKDYPLAFNYFVSLGYMLCYNLLPVIFLYYTDSITKIIGLLKPIRIMVFGSGALLILLNVTSPWTHLVAYFDDDLVYRHGPLIIVFYIWAFLIFVISAIIFNRGRVSFTGYQKKVFNFFVLFLFASIGIQLVFPEILLGGYGVATSLVFIYMAFENPMQFCYGDTASFNRRAFISTYKKCLRENIDVSILLAYNPMHSHYIEKYGRTNTSRGIDKIAARINDAFKGKSYFLEDNLLAVVLTDDRAHNYEEQYEKFKECISVPLTASTGEILIVPFNFALIPTGCEKNSNIGIIDILIDNLVRGKHLEILDPLTRVDTIINEIKRRTLVGRKLDEAIANDGFNVVYQPIYSVKEKKFISAEALVRIKDMSDGFISPEEFIPMAEESNLIQEVGLIVMDKVCRFMHDFDYKSHGIKYIEVNLSPLQAAEETLDKLGEIARGYDLPPEAFNLEITETAEAIKIEDLVNNIQELSKLGIGFSLDDFGSGFSAMDYLFKMPVNLVKIDKSILWRAMEDKDAMIVLEETIHMVKSLGKEILVEGVENQEMVDLLIRNNVDFMQGYFYSKPIPADEYLRFLDEHNSSSQD